MVTYVLLMVNVISKMVNNQLKMVDHENTNGIIFII